jgi:hypothetical protein
MEGEMQVVLVPKNKTPAQPSELLSDLALEIDNLGEQTLKAEPILKKIKELTAELKPWKDAEAALKAKVDALEADDDADDIVEKGAKFEITIGKKGSSRSIKDMALTKKLLGNELFMKLATVKLGDLDQYMTLPQRAQVIETSRTARSYKVTRRV